MSLNKGTVQYVKIRGGIETKPKETVRDRNRIHRQRQKNFPRKKNYQEKKQRQTEKQREKRNCLYLIENLS